MYQILRILVNPIHIPELHVVWEPLESYFYCFYKVTDINKIFVWSWKFIMVNTSLFESSSTGQL